MNIHLNDKITYYLPIIFKLAGIENSTNIEDFIADIEHKSRKRLLDSWEKLLKEKFQKHIALSLALLFALYKDEANCEKYLRLSRQKGSSIRAINIIRCLLFCELAIFDEALQILKNQSMEISKMSFILRIKADIHFAMKEYNIAESFYRKVLGDIPRKSTIFSRIGEICLLKNDLSEAKDYFKKAINLDNKNIMAHFYLGDIYKLNGDIKKAKMEYGISAAIDLDHHLSKMAQQKLFLLCAENQNLSK